MTTTTESRPEPIADLTFVFDDKHCWLDLADALSALTSPEDQEYFLFHFSDERLPDPAALHLELQWPSMVPGYPRSPADWARLRDVVGYKANCNCARLHFRDFEKAVVALLLTIGHANPDGTVDVDLECLSEPDEATHVPDWFPRDLMDMRLARHGVTMIEVFLPPSRDRVHIELTTKATRVPLDVYVARDEARDELAYLHHIYASMSETRCVNAHLKQRTDEDVALLLAVAMSACTLKPSTGADGSPLQPVRGRESSLWQLEEAIDRADLWSLPRDAREAVLSLLPTWKLTLADLRDAVAAC